MKGKIKIAIIYWQDAAFSFRHKLPSFLPDISITFGIINSQTKEFINVGMNCTYNKKKNHLKIIDGMFIPQKTIIAINFVDYLI